MAKAPNPVPPIVSLVALHELFRQYKGLSDPENVTDAAYNAELSDALINESVIEKKGNDSFVLGLRSKPVDAEYQRAGGMDTKKLDAVAAIVINKLLKAKDESFKLPENLPASWETFSTHIFPTPKYLEFLNDRKYFKYLDEDDQKKVAAYLNRRYNELNISEGTTINYCVYLWNNDFKISKCSIISIDPIKKTATYSFFPAGLKNIVRRSVLRSIDYSHGNSILSLQMQDENPSKSYSRISILLSVSDNHLENLDLIKGVLVATMSNASYPISSEIVLERCGSYLQALEKVEKAEQRTPLLCLEVQNRTMEIPAGNLFSAEKLRTFPLSNLLAEIHGYYLCLYITQIGAVKGPGNLQKGLIHIGLDGIVTFRFPTSKIDQRGYVDQQVYRGNRFIVINYFLTQSAVQFDFEYRMEINRNHKNEGRVEYLYGCYQGFMLDTIYKGYMALVKLDGNGYVLSGKDEKGEYERYANFDAAFEANPIDGSKKIEKATTWDPIEKYGLEILKDRKYDFEADVKGLDEILGDTTKEKGHA